MAAPRIAWASCLLVLLFRVRAQVHIMAPEGLVQRFASSNGTIDGSTATFGAPFYGDRVLGLLQYGTSATKHCKEDYDVPQDTAKNVEDQVRGKLINIIMVDRGDCSFTTKVHVANKKGAHAVIIVDKKGSSMDLRSIIVADDGNGGDIKIPSVLISHDNGKLLIEATQKPKLPVVVELQWKAPADHTVQTDLWMSSASQESQKFLKDFAKKRRKLNRLVSFTPHYAVFSISSVDSSTAENLCHPETEKIHQGDFCAEDPDGPGPVTGKDVLEEDVRQLCIHDEYKVTTKNMHKNVVYSEQFWHYIERFPDKCPLDKFGEKCSRSLMKEVGIDDEQIQRCATTQGFEKLHDQRSYPAWSPRALRINGWRYSGTMDADLVTRAICSGFIDLPTECTDLIKPRDPTQPYNGDQGQSVTFGTLIGWLFGTVVLASVALLLYKRYLKKEMRATLREEVMLEVQAQIGDYIKLQGK